MKMIGCLMKAAINLVMRNHFYSFDNARPGPVLNPKILMLKLKVKEDRGTNLPIDKGRCERWLCIYKQVKDKI